MLRYLTKSFEITKNRTFPPKFADKLKIVKVISIETSLFTPFFVYDGIEIKPMSQYESGLTYSKKFVTE